MIRFIATMAMVAMISVSCVTMPTAPDVSNVDAYDTWAMVNIDQAFHTANNKTTGLAKIHDEYSFFQASTRNHNEIVYFYVVHTLPNDISAYKESVKTDKVNKTKASDYLSNLVNNNGVVFRFNFEHNRTTLFDIVIDNQSIQ